MRRVTSSSDLPSAGLNAGGRSCCCYPSVHSVGRLLRTLHTSFVPFPHGAMKLAAVRQARQRRLATTKRPSFNLRLSDINIPSLLKSLARWTPNMVPLIPRLL